MHRTALHWGTGFYLALLWSVACVWSDPVHVFVSPTGSDTNDGRSASHPVRTLHHVLDMLGQPGIHGNTVFVELMSGYHDLNSTLHIQSTSGTLVFRAYQGQEVHVTGGTRLPIGQFRHVTDSHVVARLPQAARSKVLALDLTAAGVADLGTLREFGFGITWTAPLEVFINGQPLRLAEWPNSNFINIKSTPGGQHGNTFTYDAAGHDAHWDQETEPWAYGWWYWSWADLAVPLARVDTHNHTVTLKEKTHYGVRVGHYDPSKRNHQAGYSNQGGYFRVVNMLCEIDTPGEYYIDRTHKKLYVWPNTPHQTLTSTDVVYASMIDDCIVIESSAQNVHFEDISFEACRHHAFELKATRDITLRNVEIKNTGGNAVHSGGDNRQISVLASDIHDVGGGVHIRGGDTTHLVSSQNVIRDNHIWNHARYGGEANHGISIAGVHITVSHNHLHHGQYTGIMWSGNDHVMEYNHLHHLCFNSSDCGAIHSGRNWAYRGNVIRKNHIHDVQRHFPGADVRGVMLDDEVSSALITENVFYNNDNHANIGGGRDNVISYNVMYNSLGVSVDVDGRGLGSGGHGVDLRFKLTHVPYRSEPWKSRYPQLYDILNQHPEAPEGNQIFKNVFYNPNGKGTMGYHGGFLNRSDYFDLHDNRYVHQESDYWSVKDFDFRLRCGAAQWASSVHFPTPVTVDEVGPTVPTGPHYLRAHRATPTHSVTTPAACPVTLL